MPFESRGFIFRHIEKIVSAGVALGFVATGIYVVNRTKIEEQEDPRVQIKRLLDRVEVGLKRSPPVPDTVDFVQGVRHRYEELPPPQTVPPWRIWWPLPEVYPVQRVGFNQEVSLKFDEPLDKGTVRIEGAKPEVARVEYPVGTDFRLVKLYTHETEAQFTVVGRSGRQDHVVPVLVSKEIGGKAEPPLELAAVAKRGYVQITFKVNPKNKGLGVSYYEVHRKLATDVNAKFEQIGIVQAFEEEVGKEKEKELQAELERQRKEFLERQKEFGRGKGSMLLPTTPPRPGYGYGEAGAMPGLMPGAGEGPATLPGQPGPAGGWYPPGQEPQVVPGLPRAPGVPTFPGVPGRPGMPAGMKRVVEEYACYDREVVPDEVYIYKVRTSAKKSHPAQSDFSQTVRAATPPNIAFRFIGTGGPGKVRFEVAKAVAGGPVQKETFTVGIGEEIGGVKTIPRTGRQRNFLTGCYLLDYQPRASRTVKIQRKVGKDKTVEITRKEFSRILYVDRRGNIRERWRRESPSDLWELPERGPGMQRGGMPPGMGPEMMPFPPTMTQQEYERLSPTRPGTRRRR